MKKSNPCFAIVLLNDGRNGAGRPIIMEGYLDLSREEVEERASMLTETYGYAMVVELPISLCCEIQPIHAVPGDSKAWEVKA